MRSSGLKTEERNVQGKPGAYIQVWAFVKNAEGKVISRQVLYRRESDVWDWSTCSRVARYNQIDADNAISFPLPENATSIRLDFKLTTRGQPVPAKVWVDAVEFTVQEVK